jgi:hypothetical protein
MFLGSKEFRHHDQFAIEEDACAPAELRHIVQVNSVLVSSLLHP